MYCLQKIINAASECTGLKAVPSLLPLCAEKDAVLLDVPSYSQTDDYSCGAIAAWSIVETFRPRAIFLPRKACLGGDQPRDYLSGESVIIPRPERSKKYHLRLRLKKKLSVVLR